MSEQEFVEALGIPSEIVQWMEENKNRKSVSTLIEMFTRPLPAAGTIGEEILKRTYKLVREEYLTRPEARNVHHIPEGTVGKETE